MIVLGWLMSILGAILSICGMNSYNSADSEGYGFYHHLDSSSLDDARMLLIFGAIIFILGVTLLIIGYVRKSNANNSGGYSNDNNLLNTRKCLKCGNIVYKDEKFCPRCGNDLSRQ